MGQTDFFRGRGRGKKNENVNDISVNGTWQKKSCETSFCFLAKETAKKNNWPQRNPDCKQF